MDIKTYFPQGLLKELLDKAMASSSVEEMCRALGATRKKLRR